jgi:hypothetical protein
MSATKKPAPCRSLSAEECEEVERRLRARGLLQAATEAEMRARKLKRSSPSAPRHAERGFYRY